MQATSYLYFYYKSVAFWFIHQTFVTSYSVSWVWLLSICCHKCRSPIEVLSIPVGVNGQPGLVYPSVYPFYLWHCTERKQNLTHGCG